MPLNTFVGLDADQTFNLIIDADANAGSDFTNLNDVLLLAVPNTKRPSAIWYVHTARSRRTAQH